jgi:alpha-tubulin suppressor-like RCC1 family protein
VQRPIDLSGVIAVSCGCANTVALTDDGQVACWEEDDYDLPTVPSDLDNVIRVSCGYNQVVALTAEGNVVWWNRRNERQCDVPRELEYAVEICSCFHSAALIPDGILMAWGFNDLGQSMCPVMIAYASVSQL